MISGKLLNLYAQSQAVVKRNQQDHLLNMI